MLTDRDIALLMNRNSLQGGNNDSPWWLLFARAVERAAVEAECKHTDSLLTIMGLDYSQCRSEGGTLMPRKVLTLLAERISRKTVRWRAEDVQRWATQEKA